MTLKQIAEAAGVSARAVSYALNDGGSLALETRQRVKAIADRLGYRRNMAAFATRTGRTNAVDLLMGLTRGISRIPYTLLEGVHDALESCGLRLLLSRVSAERLRSPEFMPRFLKETLADGMLVNYTHGYPESLPEWLQQYRIPAVWINTDLPHDAVNPDDKAAGRLATQHLLQLGHRRVAYLAFTPGEGEQHHCFRDRPAGYRDACAGAGLEPVEIRLESRPFWRVMRDPLNNEQLRLVLDYLRSARGSRPTAFVTPGTREAYSLIHAAARLGFSVPGDLSVVTVGDTLQAQIGVSVTTVELPWAEIGREAVAMLLRKIEVPRKRLPALRLEGRLTQAMTTAPPAG